MKRSILLVSLFLLASVSFAANEEWVGNYAYTGYYGNTYGGSPITMAYMVRIREKQPLCEIEISGFQTFKEIVCSTNIEEKQIVLAFKSYKSGEVKNIHGVEIYQVGQPLLTFERAIENGRDVLITHWNGITDPDGKKPKDGETFELVQSQEMPVPTVP